ncbi:hypothetical protein, partial [Pseudomonas helleri]|uniref:hypothetical protein n=1 Tax=Pseudomonas helleri TaxID=1608996 RepID=UPI003FD1F72B
MRHWTFDKADQYLPCRRYIPPNATPTFEAALDVHLCFTPNGLNPDSPESGFFLLLFVGASLPRDVFFFLNIAWQ